MTLNLNTRNRNTWCPGCGNFGILSSVNQVFSELIKEGIKKENLVLVSGIGCHGKIVDYLDLNSFYALHGRGIPVLTGIKLANDNLIPIGFFGDGDAYAEGLDHLIHAAKRNSNITVLVHNNGVFALTTGQVTPTSAKGQKDHTTPFGNPEEPLNMVSLMLEANATFVARTYAGNPEHMKNTIKEAIKHKGFSFVEILQPCVTYHNTFAEYSAKTYEMKGIDESKAKETGNAQKSGISGAPKSKDFERIPIGIFRRVAKPVYEDVVRELVKKS